MIDYIIIGLLILSLVINLATLGGVTAVHELFKELVLEIARFVPTEEEYPKEDFKEWDNGNANNRQ